MEIKFENLLKLVNAIENKDWILNLQYIDIPDRTLMENLYEYLLKNMDTQSHEKETIMISERLLRLGTLKIIDPYECSSNWQNFVSQSSMIKFCLKELESVSNFFFFFKFTRYNFQIYFIFRIFLMHVLFGLVIHQQFCHI